MADERKVWELAASDPSSRDGLLREVFPGNGVNTPSETMILSMLMDHYEKVFFQHANGAFPAELWPSWERCIPQMIANPRVYAYWQASKGTFWKDFVDHFDPKIQALVDRVTKGG